MSHLIWDWNGTLFDDLDIIVRSVNVTLGGLGAGPIEAADYRDHYTRPVRLFYDRLLGRRVTTEEWERIDVAFHDAYRELLGEGSLAPDAHAALSGAAADGRTQSLLSMWWHRELVPMARSLGISDYMVRIDGNRGGRTGDTKSALLRHHLEHLAGAGVSRPVVVGDSLDDARAAAGADIPAVLYDGGSHHRSELDAAGVPVAASLVEAVALACDI